MIVLHLLHFFSYFSPLSPYFYFYFYFYSLSFLTYFPFLSSFDSAENAVKKFFLRKWLKEPSLNCDDFRDLVDWRYYTDRLSRSIQKIVTIPAGKCCSCAVLFYLCISFIFCIFSFQDISSFFLFFSLSLYFSSSICIQRIALSKPISISLFILYPSLPIQVCNESPTPVPE